MLDRLVLPTLLGLALAAPLSSCGDDGEAVKEAGKRQVLTPIDRHKKRAERRQKARVFDDEGNLLESDQVVAGIVMPRGLKQKVQHDGTWVYETESSLPVLQRYFGQRLFTGQIERYGQAVAFVAANPKDTPKAPRVTVRLGPRANLPGTNLVRIKQAAYALDKGKKGRAPTELQTRAQLEARRKYAD